MTHDRLDYTLTRSLTFHSNQLICYEFPLNERIRTLLRVEALFARIRPFLESSVPVDHHIALNILFDLLEVCSRADIKSDLLQELERQKKYQLSLELNPTVSENNLNNALDSLDSIAAQLHNMQGKLGQHLRDNEWLMAIKQRANVPGGVCTFDMPSYHYWLQQPTEFRQSFLRELLKPLEPLQEAVSIILTILRRNQKQHDFHALHGVFQQMQGGRQSHLLRICVNSQLPCIPEVSANKYAINIRFVSADYAAKSTLFDQDVPFSLIFCSLQ